VEVELESGAVLLGSTNFSDYPAIAGRWEGIERKVYASLFTGSGLHEVSITGHGAMDGQGAVWWEANRKTMDLRKKKRLRGREPENPPEAPLRWPRPRMINLYHCTNVLIRDITIRNSPAWNVHPVYCQDVTLDNVTITAPAHGAPNTDAVDPDSCRNMRISNCRFDVGDDCIAIKSGYNEDGRRVGIPCENIVVTNCVFGHGHGGVAIGSEMSGSVRNVYVENCIFAGTQRGLRVKTALGRGGVIEDFRATNLVMRDISDAAFSITADYGDGGSGDKVTVAAEAIPRMRHFNWTTVTVVNAKRLADLRGLAGSPLEDFRLSHVRSTGAKAGIRCEDAAHVVLEDISLQPRAGAALEARNVKDLDVLDLSVEKPNDAAPVLLFQGVSSALVHDCTVNSGTGAFLRCEGDANQNIRLEGNHLAAGVKERGQ
jgi:polygalacturonase